MINSVFSKYKDAVHVLPSCKMSASVLFDLIKRIVLGLENIGFRIICVLSDNNAINRKAMSFFTSPSEFSIVYPHPCDNSRPLFYILDSVHIFKCIQNNWLNQNPTESVLVFHYFNLVTWPLVMKMILNVLLPVLMR